MKTFKIICAILLTAGNAASTIMCWEFLTVSYTLRLLIGLSLGCSVLALVNIKAKVLRATTYIVASVVLIVGLFYAIYCRRPLGFWVAISACIVITIYFLSESGLKSRKDNLVTNLTAVIALVAVFVFTIFSVTFVFMSKNSGIENGPETIWDSELVNDIMKHYLKGRSKDYRDLAASRTRLYLNERINPDTALKCAVALKKRDFAMDVLLDRIADNAVRG